MKTRLASFIPGILALALCGAMAAQAPDGYWGIAKRNGAAWDMKSVAPGTSKFFGTDGSGNLVLTTIPSALSDGDKGSITVSGTGTSWTINNGAVSNAMLANSGITINGVLIALGDSVSNLQTTDGALALGGFSGITGTLPIGNLPANIQTTDGALALAGFSGITGTLAVAHGGTGQTAYTNGQLLIGNTATGLLSKATLTAGSNVTITNGNGTITIAASGGGSASSVTTLKVDTTTNQTATTTGFGSTDLTSFSIPANTLSNVGDGIEFDVWGTFANNSNSKEVSIKFGATFILDATSNTFNNMVWRVHGRVVKTGSSSEIGVSEMTYSSGGAGSGGTFAQTGSPSEATTGAITFKLIGGGTAAGDVVQKGMVLKYVPKEP